MRQQLGCEGGAGLGVVALDESTQYTVPMRGLDALPYDAVGIDVLGEFAVGVVDEGHAARHAGGEIVADEAQDRDRAARHVLAAVGAAAFHHRGGARVAHGEALAGLSRRKQMARGRTVEDRVAGDGVVARAKRVETIGRSTMVAPDKPFPT